MWSLYYRVLKINASGTIHKGRPHWRGGGGYLKSRKMRTWGRGGILPIRTSFFKMLIWQFQVLAYLILGQRGAAEAFKSWCHSYFIFSLHACHKLVLPWVTRIVKLHAFTRLFLSSRGGRGSKIPEILRTSFMYGPHSNCFQGESSYRVGCVFGRKKYLLQLFIHASCFIRATVKKESSQPQK